MQFNEFKIDTKLNYSIIKCPNGALDVKMAEDLTQKVNEWLKDGRNNFIIDLSDNEIMAFEAGAPLLELHHQLYKQEHSFVIACPQTAVLALMKKEQWHLDLNICPTLQEAVDIVNMEILERDLLKEL